MKKNLLFVTLFDPSDPSAWAGTQASMITALEEDWKVALLYLRPPFWLRVCKHLFAVIFPNRATVDYSRASGILERYSARIAGALDRQEFDFVFSPSSVPLSRYRGPVPAAFWTDALYTQMVGFYGGEFARVTQSSFKRGAHQEADALASVSAAYSSQWAIDEALRLCPSSQPLLLGFGPNLPEQAIARIRQARSARNSSNELHLLWIGNDWSRKGGDTSLLIALELRRRGVNVHLDVVGVDPPVGAAAIGHRGHLKKSSPAELAILESLFTQADFLILPSQADCSPIVVSEAASVGLPVIATDVGGLGETVLRFNMGIVHRLDQDIVEDVVSEVLSVIASPERLDAMKQAALGAGRSLSYESGFKALFGTVNSRRNHGSN